MNAHTAKMPVSARWGAKPRKLVTADNSEATNGRIYTGAEIEAMSEAEMIERRDQLEARGFMTRAAELRRGWAFQHKYTRDMKGEVA